MSNEVEQTMELKDGRTIFKTNNGFSCWVKTKKGEVTEVTEAYYQSAKRLAIKSKK